jgi:hypothetical protein
MIFPCDGRVSSWTLTDEYYDYLCDTFPSHDVDAELRKAHAWIDARPAKRKTARGMKRFIVGWLSRAEPKRTPKIRVGSPEYYQRGAALREQKANELAQLRRMAAAGEREQ